MAYGDYDGPDKPNKGKEGGSCNRGLCQDDSAPWYNHGSYAWYCESCKRQIYDYIGQRYWRRDFPNVDYPMFETREMMNERENPEPIKKTVGTMSLDDLIGMTGGLARRK